MKKFIYFLIITSFYFANSQNLIQEFPLELNKNTEYLNIFDTKTNENGLFFFDKENMKCIKLNEKLEVNTQFNIARPDKKYKSIIGFKNNANVYTIYWNSKNAVLEQNIDFTSQKVSTKEVLYELKGEEIINRITLGSKFYTITITRDSNTLNIYSFEDKVIKKSISFDDKRFFNSEGRTSTLWNLIAEKRGRDFSYNMEEILTEMPPSLIKSSEKRKCYVIDNQMILVFDNSLTSTQTITINLEDFTSSQNIYSKPYVKETEFGIVDSNSFIFDNKIIQLKMNNDKMLILIKTLDNIEIKTLEINDKEEIKFKNSDIIQENGNIKNKRILDNTNKFLRKIISEFPAISFYKKDNTVLMTVGGVSPIKDNYASSYGGIIGGFSGSLIGSLLSSYSVENVNSYNNRKVMYVNCLFDENFNHLPKEIAENPFDKLRLFIHNNEQIEKQIVFKINEDLYLGGYDKESLKYEFYKFSN
jgi:hypothetical protein